jgi:hypothetical protein
MAQDVGKSRIANAATEPEIEITEEMIEAGVEAAGRELISATEISPSFSSARLVVAVFEAMMASRHDHV